MKWFTCPVIAAMALLSFAHAEEQPTSCQDSSVSVLSTDSGVRKQVCDLATGILTTLRTCHVDVDRQITIKLNSSLDDHCLGVYHCGSDEIDLLYPDRFEAQREPGSAFSTLGTDPYYASVLAHELAHAAYDGVHCPFGYCLATSEYVAYTMQIYSLDRDSQLAFEAEIPYEARISRDELNPMIVLMAPDIFAQKAWLHFSQREDGCAFVQQIMNGNVLLDYEHP